MCAHALQHSVTSLLRQQVQIGYGHLQRHIIISVNKVLRHLPTRNRLTLCLKIFQQSFDSSKSHPSLQLFTGLFHVFSLAVSTTLVTSEAFSDTLLFPYYTISNFLFSLGLPNDRLQNAISLVNSILSVHCFSNQISLLQFFSEWCFVLVA